MIVSEIVSGMVWEQKSLRMKMTECRDENPFSILRFSRNQISHGTQFESLYTTENELNSWWYSKRSNGNCIKVWSFDRHQYF